jgi:hypothetical protein
LFSFLFICIYLYLFVYLYLFMIYLFSFLAGDERGSWSRPSQQDPREHGEAARLVQVSGTQQQQQQQQPVGQALVLVMLAPMAGPGLN